MSVQCMDSPGDIGYFSDVKGDHVCAEYAVVMGPLHHCASNYNPGRLGPSKMS